MTKHIFDNHMTAHLWANQTQDSARSHNGNFWFERETIYSYRTPIGRIVETTIGRVALVSCESFSPTTQGKHKGAIARALDYGRFMPTFYVPFIACGGRGAGRLMGGVSEREIAESNLKHLEDSYYNARQRLLKAREPQSWGIESLHESYRARIEFANAFGINYTSRNVHDDIREIEERWTRLEAKRNDPVELAKRERERERREARAIAEIQSSIDAWRNGVSDRAPYWRATWQQQKSLPIILRVRGEEVETSRGATVPTRHAMLAWPRIKKCRETGIAWQRNGSEIRVGHFQFDSIDWMGNVRAGCHFIKYEELARLAVTLGLES